MDFKEQISAQYNEYLDSHYGHDRTSFGDIQEYYKQEHGKNWTAAFAKDLQDKGGLTTSKVSIQRQLNRFQDGTRKPGKKYQEAFNALSKELPKKREVPKDAKIKYKAKIKAKISQTKIDRKMSGELSAEQAEGENPLAAMLEAYAEDGSIDAEEWEDSLEDISMDLEEG